jgi:F0F1-type ATP synthase membrane subunit b/b'
VSARRSGILAGALILLAASTAGAAEHGGASLGDVVVRLVNFALAVGVLVWVFTRVFSLRDFFAGRRGAIEGELASVERQLQEAKARIAAVQEQVARVGEEVETIVATGRRQAEAEAKRIVEASRERSRRISEIARHARDQEESRLVAEVREELVDEALRAAEALVAERFDDNDHRRLIEEALS